MQFGDFLSPTSSRVLQRPPAPFCSRAQSKPNHITELRRPARTQKRKRLVADSSRASHSGAAAEARLPLTASEAHCHQAACSSPQAEPNTTLSPTLAAMYAAAAGNASSPEHIEVANNELEIRIPELRLPQGWPQQAPQCSVVSNFLSSLCCRQKLLTVSKPKLKETGACSWSPPQPPPSG